MTSSSAIVLIGIYVMLQSNLVSDIIDDVDLSKLCQRREYIYKVHVFKQSRLNFTFIHRVVTKGFWPCSLAD